ncbi:hypothetical protein ACOMHN_044916 [Nucella lapillus]
MKTFDFRHAALRLLSHSTSRLQDDVYKHIMELGILHNSPPSTKHGCRAGRLHRLWHGLPPAPWPCTRSQHLSVPSRNLHPLMVPPFLQPHPDLQSAVGNAPLSSKHPAQLPTTDCLLSIISPMGGQPSDAPALSPPSPLQQGGQSSNAPALSPPSPLPQGGQPIALALSPPSPPPQGGQPNYAPGLSPSSSTLLLCPSDSTLNICHLNSQSAVKTGKPETISDYILEQKLDIVILTETWLSESGHETSCNLMTPSGFVLKSYPRASKGGGIAVIFRESLVPHVTFKKALPFRHSTFEQEEEEEKAQHTDSIPWGHTAEVDCGFSAPCVTPTSDQPSGPVCSLSTAASRQHLTSLQAPCAVCPLQRHANICPAFRPRVQSVHCSVTPTSDQPSGPVCSLSTAASRQHLTSLQAPCAVCPLQRHANI